MTGSHKPFGKYLREKRTAKGYSLRRFAELLGVSPTYLSHVEQGKVDSPLTAKLAKRAAELLGENPDEFVVMAGRVPEDLARIIRSKPDSVPELLRATRALRADQVRELAQEAKRMGRGATRS